jgi:chemotaxis protein MotB
MITEEESATGSDEGENYFVAMTDMMVGVLFIFILMLMAFALDFRRTTDKQEDALLVAQQVAAKLDTLQADMQRQMTQLDRTQQDRRKLLLDIREQLAAEGLSVQIDEASGVLRLTEDAVRFAPNRSDLVDRNKENVGKIARVLDRVLPGYVGCGSAWTPGCTNGEHASLETLFIEGHTDTTGTDAENWRLSTERAVATFRELIAVAAVGAAIEPFGDTMPGKELRDRFLSFALKLLGDPRVNALRWQGCLKARDIACRWLTEQSLRQFFEVVDHVARPEHWNYRHAFWNALYEKNYIYDAWVVFDRYGAAEARRMFQGKISFATFNETVQQGHAVLLLRIGSLIIAEWSHTGSCRIWDTSKGESGPQLYKNRYRKVELQAQVNPEGVFGHYNPTGYFWQRKIAEYLRSRCNIVLYQTITKYANAIAFRISDHR